MKKVDLSIIIVSYNTRDLTVAAVESVIETVKKTSFEIIIVDNASTDDSVKALKTIKDPRVSLVENSQNYGFSKANNIGIKKSSGGYVLFLNSDTVVYENTLDQMVVFMEKNTDAGAATCYIEMPNGLLDDGAHRGFPTPWRALTHFSGLSKLFPRSKLFAGYNLGHLNMKEIHEIEALVGAFMLVRREAGEEVGWWDEDFFWYGEDLDFCYRLKEKGWKIFFVPEYKILHYKGASGGIKKISQNISTATAETRKKATDARFTAMKIFYNKHYKKKYPSFMHSLVLSGIHLKWFISRLKHRL